MTQTPGSLRELIALWAAKLDAESADTSEQRQDHPIDLSQGRLIRSVGTLHLYRFDGPVGAVPGLDVPVTLVLPDGQEPTEGLVLRHTEGTVWLQTLDPLGATVPAVTLVPDRAGFLSTAAQRLVHIAANTDRYPLGPADRLFQVWDLVSAGQVSEIAALAPTSVLSMDWSSDDTARRQKLAALSIELIRTNKHVLLVTPDHATADVITGILARAMKAAALTYRSWVSRYEVALAESSSGMPLTELGFEAQMHQFYAKSRAEKAALRKKYDRFRELTPLLSYKAQKQRDLDEVRLLEWRLVTQLTEYQDKIKEIDATTAAYEELPLFKRLAMQAVGKNVESLREYRQIYERQSAGLRRELDIAKRRIAELIPEATVPKDIKPEYEELKEEVSHLGGTKKIRELLAAEDNTNRQMFIQNRRVVISTADRVMTDPLFTKVPFDVLIAEHAPRIPWPSLLASAALVRERIILSGDPRDLAVEGAWAKQPSLRIERERHSACLPSG